MLREPPDILITTPESLFLLLTSRARELLRSVDTLILDEVHAVAGTKRGVHLALSVERLEALAAQTPQRIGLSATQRPLEEIGKFVSGGRPIELVDAGVAKELDLEVVVPVDDMRELGSTAALDQGEYVRGAGDSYITPGREVGARSIWPSIYPALVELVRAHRSTIVFVNNRRLAERLALRLNELAEEEVARAHHGSLAREQRTQIEEDLKAGRIPCLVATSSLELGIDMGAVDLVIQVESPKSVARGLQRIGRAGHSLGEVSRGRIFPKFRADLLSVRSWCSGCGKGLIEETQIPRNPLDVLAQQIVAICADEEIEVAELHELVRRAYPFADLSRSQLENVLDMLAGRYPSDEFAELRPRSSGIARPASSAGGRARGGSRSRTRARSPTAGSSACSSPATAALVSASSTRRWSTRRAPAKSSCLARRRGGSRRSPATACSSHLRRACRVRCRSGRARASGARTSSARRSAGSRASCSRREIRRCPISTRCRRRTSSRFSASRRTRPGRCRRIAPSSIERFRDEIGDWRVCILTPFGARVHAPWAMAVGARLRESLGIEVQSIWSDDGIAFHLPDADSPPATDLFVLDPDVLEELVLAEVGQTALFGARFRENAARALLIPRRRPGERTPLWQQRLKAQGLLQVARKYSSFPIVLETYRECLQDVFDLPALKRLLGRFVARVRPRRRRDGVGVALRVVAPLRLHRDVHVRGRHAAGGAACAGTLARPRPAARAARPGGAARAHRPRRARRGGGVAAAVSAELRGSPRCASLRGDVRVGEFDESHAAILEAERRAIRVRIADEGAARRRRMPAATATRSASCRRRAARRVPRTGSRRVALARRAVRARPGPFTTAEASAWFGVEVEEELRLERGDKLVRGELRPGGTEREWCDADVLRRLRRASLAALRREVEPVEQAALGRFLSSWHGIDRRASLREAVIPLQALALPVALWESEVLPRRVPEYRPSSSTSSALRRARVGRSGARPRRRLLPRGRRRCSAVLLPRRCRRARFMR